MGSAGAVEPSESLRAAVRREIREESGVEARVGRPLAVERQRFEHPEDPTRAVVGWHVTFEAVATDARLAEGPGVEGETIEAVDWFETIPRGYSRGTSHASAGVKK